MKRLALAAALFLSAVPATAPAQALLDESSGVFTLPDGLVSAVEFWKAIYSTYDTKQVVMHDNRYLHVIYGVLDFHELAKGRTEGQLEALVEDANERERERIIAILLELDSYEGGVPFQKLTPEARRIYDAFEDVEELDKFAAAAERVRGQRGQSDRFLAGIAEVEPYMPELEQIFRDKGLPTDLTRLVFVESMFNLHAYSKVGAAGPWQFMSYTGKRFLTISPEVDERMDPIRSTQAAASLLAENHAHLGDWGLALTAYNHGVAGMRRAATEVGSTDIGQIVWAYESRSFGFASRNFYAEFLAARDVYNNRERYFGSAVIASLPAKTRAPYDEVVLPDFVAIGTLSQYCQVMPEELKAHNPSLTRYVLSGQKYLPKGYPLKVPAGKGKLVVKGYANIPSTHRYVAQKANEFHVVRRGETLAAIARKYGMSMDGLVDLNGLTSRNRIKAGQRLRVLAPDKAATVATAPSGSKPKKPEVKIVPVVKLPEDEAATVAAAAAAAATPQAATGATDVPVPELTEEQQELLAAAEAPAVDEGTTVALAGASPGAAAPAAPYVPPTATAVARGSLALASLAASLPSPSTAKPPLAIAAAQPLAAPPLAAATAVGAAPVDASVAPIAAAGVPASADAGPAELVWPASVPLPPARDRADARAGEPAATYPGGIRCTLTRR